MSIFIAEYPAYKEGKVVNEGKIDDKSAGIWDPLELKNILLLNNQFIYITNLNGKCYAYLDKSLKEILGYHPHGFDFDNFSERIHPDDRKIVVAVVDKMVNLICSIPLKPMEHSLNMDFRIKTKSGEYKRIMRQSSVFKCTPENKPSLILHLCTDISYMHKNNGVEVSFSGRNSQKIRELLEIDNGDGVSLSHREIEIVKYISSGLSSKEIGEALFISKNTVDTHRRNMLKKLNLKNTAELVNFCREKSLI
jgi:DNA-binding CsgD family transcriptional regulator